MPTVVAVSDEKTLTTIGGTKTGNGDNTLIAAVASKRIVITAVTLQNESSTATTMQLIDGGGSGTVIERVLGQNQGDGVSRVYPADARPRLTVGNALVLNLSGANSCGYTVQYYLE